MIPDDRVFHLSLIVATLGRTDELERLFSSIASWPSGKFEVIIVDQNRDDRLVPLIRAFESRMAIRHVRTDRKGVCRARNLGASRAKGEWLLFPDDDCWYPADLFDRFQAAVGTLKVDFHSGRAINEAGETIMGRFSEHTETVRRDNVWSTLIEWMLFVRKSAFERAGAFDEAIGPGSGTAWGAYEVQDLALRLLGTGAKGRYDPALTGYHPDDRSDIGTDGSTLKMQLYGAGLGYVMRKHGYGFSDYLPHLLRPLAGAAVYTMTGRPALARRSRAILAGRWTGWRDAPARTIF